MGENGTAKLGCAKVLVFHVRVSALHIEEAVPQVRRGLIRVLALQIGEADVAARMKATSKFTPNRARKPIGLSRS